MGVRGVPGGVSGWIARMDYGDLRRAGALPSATPAPRNEHGAKARPRAGAAPVGRLLRQAEKHWLRLQGERDRILEAVTTTSDYVEMTRLGAELDEAQAALEQAETAWLALAEQAESEG